MSQLTKKIDNLPETEEFLRRLNNIAHASQVVAQSDDYETFEEELNGNRKIFRTRYDDGSGNEFTVVETTEGVFVWGFDHESEHSIYNEEIKPEHQKALQNVPDRLSWILTEESFNWGNPIDDPHIYATVAFWSVDGRSWQYSHELEKYDEYDDGGFKYFFKHIINYSPEKYVTYLTNLQYDITDAQADEVALIFKRRK